MKVKSASKAMNAKATATKATKAKAKATVTKATKAKAASIAMKAKAKSTNAKAKATSSGFAIGEGKTALCTYVLIDKERMIAKVWCNDMELRPKGPMAIPLWKA